MNAEARGLAPRVLPAEWVILGRSTREHSERTCVKWNQDLPQFVCGSDLLVWIKFRVRGRALSLVFSGSPSLLILSLLCRDRLQSNILKKKKSSPILRRVHPVTPSPSFSTISLLESAVFKVTLALAGVAQQ